MIKLAEFEFEIEVIQYLRPSGAQHPITTLLPIKWKPLYMSMRACGYRIELEILRTNEISVTIAVGALPEDMDIEIVKNDREVLNAITTMLERERGK